MLEFECESTLALKASIDPRIAVICQDNFQLRLFAPRVGTSLNSIRLFIRSSVNFRNSSWHLTEVPKPQSDFFQQSGRSNAVHVQ